MTTRCTYCRTELVDDDDETLPICAACRDDERPVIDRDRADAAFQQQTADPNLLAGMDGSAL